MNRSLQIKAMASEARMLIMKLLAEPQNHFGNQWSADPIEFGMHDADRRGAGRGAAYRQQAFGHTQAGRFIIVRKQQKWSYCKRNEAAIQDYMRWLREELSLQGSDDHP